MREAKIGVAPYSDNSGYAITVSAKLIDDIATFTIEGAVTVSAELWPGLQDAVEDALLLVAGPAPKTPLELAVEEVRSRLSQIGNIAYNMRGLPAGYSVPDEFERIRQLADEAKAALKC